MPRSLRGQVALAVGFAVVVTAPVWWTIAIAHMAAATWAERVLMGFGAWTIANWCWDAARDTRQHRH